MHLCLASLISRGFDALDHIPGLKKISGIGLDIIFGPEDDFDYVSTTAPPPPPKSPSQEI